MKTFYLDKFTGKRLEMAKLIINNEDLFATVAPEYDALGNLMLAVTCSDEDYQTLKEIYEMVC